MKHLDIEVDLPTTQRLTQRALQGARDQLNQMVHEHASLHQQELEQQIETATARGQQQKAKIIRAIKKVETGKHTYQILKAMRQSPGSTHSIDISN